LRESLATHKSPRSMTTAIVRRNSEAEHLPLDGA
jgi:hypothetical protein